MLMLTIHEAHGFHRSTAVRDKDCPRRQDLGDQGSAGFELVSFSFGGKGKSCFEKSIHISRISHLLQVFSAF